MSDVTGILSQMEQGDPHAAEKLLPLVYDELRKLAAAKLAQERPGQTLQATALVHEAYLRLVGPASPTPDSLLPIPSFSSRAHFFAAAAEAMRRILVDQARRKQSQRRGGNLNRIPLDDIEITTGEPQWDQLAVSEALEKLERVDRIAAQLVKLRYYAGLT